MIIKQDGKNRTWHEVNLENKILGRAATGIAQLLMGKAKPDYAANSDCGDNVVVVNVDKIKVSGRKLVQKVYTTYSGYPGGLKREKLGKLLERRPEDVVRRAVWGMLPKNKLRDRMIKRLYVYSGAVHPFKDKLKK